MNPFGLVYQDAITENKENEVNIQKITYILDNIKYQQTYTHHHNSTKKTNIRQ